LSDIAHKVSRTYGVLVDEEKDSLNGVSLRGTFLIDEKGILRHSSINDSGVGRNVDETLRILKAFQYSDKHGEVCPARWEPGKPAMQPKAGSDKLNQFWKQEHSKTKH
jgi:alkyl hydroperoxide reductase subunit AhpC